MQRILFLLLTLLLISTTSHAQTVCDPAGNVIIYSNYDGGVLNINCDVNIPNLKIGVVSYEPVTINISGTYASNVTEVRYAGYVATNNNHCPNSPPTTTITGVNPGITSVNFLPPATLNNPNGYNMIICNYSCDINNNQGGCNTPDQVVDYFLTNFGGSVRYHFTQYGCWAVAPYNVSSAGNCCAGTPPPPGPCNLTVNAGPDVILCEGTFVQLACNNNQPGITTCTWSPAAGLDNPLLCNPTASPAIPTTYIVTCTDTAGCTASDTILVDLYPQTMINCNPPVTALCQNGNPLTLNYCSPTGGTYSGSGVTGNMLDPSQLPVGQTQVIYTYADVNGCISTWTDVIDILAPAAVNLILPDDSVCVNDSSFILSGGTPAGGTFSGAGVSGNNFDPGTAGAGQSWIYYDYNNPNGCPGSDSALITVVPNPPAPTIIQTYIDSMMVSPAGDAYQWFQTGIPYATDGPTIFVDLWYYYTCQIMVDGCWSPVSDSVLAWYEGVEDGTNAQPFILYPNPTKGNFIIEWPEEIQLTQVEIYDAGGKLILQENVTGNSREISMGTYANGTYWIVGKTEHAQLRSRIILMK